MTYIRDLFFNFLVVFFVNRAIPGIQITYFEQVPHLGTDALFAAIVGFFNGSIAPFLSLMEWRVNWTFYLVYSLFISLLSFAVIYWIPFGVQVTTLSGYFLGSMIVALSSFISNFLQWQRASDH